MLTSNRVPGLAVVAQEDRAMTSLNSHAWATIVAVAATLQAIDR
jgi:hypothetical protein